MAIAYSNTEKLCIDCAYYILDRTNGISIRHNNKCLESNMKVYDIKKFGCSRWRFYDLGI